MKMPKLLKKHRMQATTRRVDPRESEEYDGEPNIRLSSAIAVVLVLHVVAVAGIYAFNGLKKHKLPPQSPASVSQAAPVAPVLNGPAAPIVSAQPKVTSTVPKQTAHEPSVEKPAPKTAAPANIGTLVASGQVYTVAKGDNPVGIARKFSVNYDELLRLNKIDDPRKLQVGQKLHLPKSKAAKVD